MKRKKTLRFSRLLGAGQVLAILCIAWVSYANRDLLTAENLLRMAPQGTLKSFLFLLSLYCLKSVSIVFPSAVLYVLGSWLFPPKAALAVNYLGIVCGILLNYGLGRTAGAELVDTLCTRWPKLELLVERLKMGPFLFPFLLRLAGVIPYDVGSLYFGASRHPFCAYLAGSALGVIPDVVLMTLLGISLTDPGSPLFWAMLAIKLFSMAVATGVFFILKQNNGK